MEPLRKLDLNLLLVFDAIYSTRNISKAADEMGVSQPTMSNALARLRAAVDDPLFMREQRGVTPTARADELIGPVRRALEEIRRITAPVNRFDPATSKREFRILMTDALEAALMPPLIERALASEGLSFRMILAPATPVTEALEQGLADLVVNVPAPSHRDFRWEVLCPMDVVFLARKGHPEIDGAITPEQMRRLPHISLDMAPGRMANAHLLNLTQRIDRRDVVMASRVNSIPELVARSDLIGLASRIQVLASADCDRLQILQPPRPISTQNFHLTWHVRNEEDPGLVWLRSELKEIAARWSGGAEVEGLKEA